MTGFMFLLDLFSEMEGRWELLKLHVSFLGNSCCEGQMW